MNPEPSTSRIMDFLEGRMSPARAEEVRRGLARESEDVRARLRWLQSFQEQARTARLESPPAELRERLLAEFRRHHRVHLGELLFDSRRDAVEVRAVGLTDRWSCIHTSDVADTAIDFARAGDRVTVSGQVLTAEGDPVELVELRDGSELVAEADLDPFGQFSFGVVHPGAYQVMVFLAGATMRVDLVVDP